MATIRLTEVAVRNFKGIDDVRFSIPPTDPDRPGSGEFVSVVGENNVGKSSILEALRLALPGTGFTNVRAENFPEHDEGEGPIEVEFAFDDLTPEDEERRGVRTHVYEGRFRLKKQWDSPGSDAVYFAYEPKYELPEWFMNKGRRHTFIEEGGDPAREIVEIYEEDNEDIDYLNKKIRGELRSIAIEIGSPFVSEDDPSWQENPGGIQSNVDSVLPNVVMVPAIKDPSEETETGRKSSSVGSIMADVFENHIFEQDIVQEFREKGEEVRSLFEGEDKDDVIAGVEQRISEKVSRMIDIEATIDFDPPDVTGNLAGRTSLDLVHEGVQTSPEHQGHGAQRALILSLLEIIAEDRTQADEEDEPRRSLLLLIEEPEIYMHPQMLRRMRDVLLEIAQDETAQVIATTHSPVFLDLADRHDGILVVEKEDGEIDSLQRDDDLFSGENAEESRKRLRMILDFDPSVNEVFFSRRVCLVEGDTEIAAVEAIARRLDELGRISWRDYLNERRFVTVVGCRGKWNICAFQRVLNGFGIDYVVVHDTDEEGEDEGANARINDLQEVGEILTHDPNFEEEIFGERWPDHKPWRATREIMEWDQIPEPGIRYFEFVLGEEIENLAG